MGRLSEKGIAFLKDYEELRLVAYQDAKGVWTIGWGSTRDVKEGDTISVEEAEQRLRNDVKFAEDAVSKGVIVPLAQHEFDALVSLTFNIGVGAFLDSTLLKRLNEGKKDAAARQILRWNKCNGRELAGLTNRRRKEQRMFLYGEYKR